MNLFLTRVEYDVLIVSHNGFLLELNSKYKKTWGICGPTFLNLSQDDYGKIYNILF